MTAPCYVWSDVFGAPCLVGASALVTAVGEFRYAPDYIRSQAPAIDPINLPVDSAALMTLANRGVFGVLADAGPETWGRRVLTALHPRQMASASGLDVLLMSTGHGAGALLFSQSRTLVHPRRRGIALADLSAAAEGAHQIEMGEVLREQLRQLMESGTSLGGMHPKVAITDPAGVDWIAKFRSREDTVDTPRIEWATMRLAKQCDIDAAEVELTAVGERPALLVRRFDRVSGSTLHYASAHALWNKERASEHDALGWASYAGIVTLLKQLPGADVRRWASELFRRLVFNVVVGNTDDHGRNHGFLMDAAGTWRLAPAFDVLPSVGSQGAVQALGAGPAGRERSLENVLAGAANFGLDQVKAKSILGHIRKVVRERLPPLLGEARTSGADREAVLSRVLRA